MERQVYQQKTTPLAYRGLPPSTLDQHSLILPLLRQYQDSLQQRQVVNLQMQQVNYNYDIKPPPASFSGYSLAYPAGDLRNISHSRNFSSGG